MTDNQTRLVFLVVLGAVVILLLFFAFLKQKLKDMDPIYETKAEVLSKRVVSQSHRGTYGSVNGHYYIVTFRTEDGAVIELRTSEGSGRYEEGSKGNLIYQADKCEKFTPDK